MVDAADLKSAVAKAAYGFESRPRHIAKVQHVPHASRSTSRINNLDLFWLRRCPLASFDSRLNVGVSLGVTQGT